MYCVCGRALLAEKRDNIRSDELNLFSHGILYNSRECCVLSAGVKGLLLHINTTHFMCTSLCLRTASTDQAGPPSLPLLPQRTMGEIV